MVSAAKRSEGTTIGAIERFDPSFGPKTPQTATTETGWQRLIRLWAPPGEPLGRYALQTAVMALLAVTSLSGPVKQVLPSFPLDLTLISTVLSFALGLVYAVLAGRWPSARQLGMLGLILLIALAGASTSVPTEYGQIKLERLFTVTFVAAVAVVFPVRHQRDAVRFLTFLAALSLSLAVWIAITGQNQYGAGGRLTTEEGSTIPYGRAAGYVLVLTVAWLLTTPRLTPVRLLVAGSSLAMAVWTMIAIASRGPIQAVVLAIAAMLAIQAGAIHAKVLVTVGIAFVALAGGLWALWETIPVQSRERVTVVSGGSSADARAYAWDVTWRALDVSPVGNGWGSYARLREADLLTYPHNLFLEIWFEAGVIGLVAVLVLVGSTLRHQVGMFSVDRAAAKMGIGAAVYWLASAMVSGDVNDNKAMWMVFAALAATISAAAVPDSGPGREVLADSVGELAE